MNLVTIRIITEQIEPIVNFYKNITQADVVTYTPEFAELRTAWATLAIGSIKTLAFFDGENIAQPASNRTMILEFSVADVDQQYKEISEFIRDSLVQAPKTMPWGNRSMLFRDPDGNLINFFTPQTDEAKQRGRVENLS
jgi:predicted enzyme related to lactoylglutathione lyase